MRIRSTKPEFWRSKTIAALAWDVRLVLKGLESYVDDNGVGKDDIALIAADVFPRDLSRDPRETLARLSEAISTLHTRGLIARYESDGEELLYIDKWKELQRIDKPARGRYPRPDGTFEYTEPVNRDSYRSPRETVASLREVVAPGTGEQRNRGTGDQGSDITSVNETTYVDEPSVNSLEEAAREVGIEDLAELTKTLSDTTMCELTPFSALVLAEEFGKQSQNPVANLGGYVATACRNTPERVREFFASVDLGVTA